MENSLIIPTSEIKDMARAMGPLFQKKPEDAFALMLVAQSQGLHPATAMLEFDVIQGRPAINSKSALARFQSHGGSIQWLERSDEKCSCKFSHPNGGELVVTWDMDRAKQAKLTGKDNWQKYPAQMLSARVIAEGVRAVYPACLSGLYTAEEVADFDRPEQGPPRTVTPPNNAAVKKADEARQTVNQPTEESVEAVKKIFGGHEVESAEDAEIQPGELKESLPSFAFEDDIPETKEEKVIKAVLANARSESHAEIKCFILDYVLVKAAMADKESAAQMIARLNGNPVTSLLVYLDLYTLHPAVMANEELVAEMYNAKQTEQAKLMFETLVKAYECAK